MNKVYNKTMLIVFFDVGEIVQFEFYRREKMFT